MNSLEKMISSILTIFIAVVLIYAFTKALLGVSVLIAIVFFIVAAVYVYNKHLA
jgi:hypothetical protein